STKGTTAQSKKTDLVFIGTSNTRSLAPWGAGNLGAHREPYSMRLPARTLSVKLMVHFMATLTSKPSRPARGNGQPADRAFSSIVVDGPERAASRAMLHAVGFQADDFKKSQIGVASTWSMVTPCNMHIDQLAVHVAQGINQAGG